MGHVVGKFAKKDLDEDDEHIASPKWVCESRGKKGRDSRT